MNKNSELSLNELDHVAGGDIIDIAVAWAIGKGLDALALATDHTVSNVGNAVLVACGQKPIL